MSAGTVKAELLEGIRCPRCSQTDSFLIDLQGPATVEPEQVVFEVEPEARDDATIVCIPCDNDDSTPDSIGTVAEFRN